MAARRLERRAIRIDPPADPRDCVRPDSTRARRLVFPRTCRRLMDVPGSIRASNIRNLSAMPTTRRDGPLVADVVCHPRRSARILSYVSTCEAKIPPRSCTVDTGDLHLQRTGPPAVGTRIRFNLGENKSARGRANRLDRSDF